MSRSPRYSPLRSPATLRWPQERSALPHPTLIVRGERDAWVPPEIADELCATIGGSRLVRIQDAGRLVPEEAPEALANLVLDFVGARGTGGTF